MSVSRIQLDDYSVRKPAMRHAIAENDPPIALSRHVYRFVAWPMQDCQRADRGIVAENSPRTPRRILAVSHREKKQRAEQNPRGVEQPIAPAHRGYHSGPMTRAEIEEKLIAIVRKEKDVPDDKLSLETPLADAGIDSLDALTILFAIEEEFHISVPDDRSRAMKTFGDMVDSIEMLLASSGNTAATASN
jgi:acyl carrier protein